ncbi:stage V sporulation protein SpoVM [Phocea massiliensis]|uniref:Stage V sporulation protein SpoVM n=1 Tax=Merdimmobilis hominis TaxID=2897707 RepID=A0A938X6H7_9FIRM|nr:stage V sporulation protein SpoVM [Merdimmobilis hominis]
MAAAQTHLRGRPIFMKVVVLKSPKFLAGILRLIFKIQKEDV